MKKTKETLFIVFCLFCLLVPLFSVPWTRPVESENRVLALWPKWQKEDGSWNTDLLAQAGAWYEDHFGMRPALISLWSHVSGLLGRSGSDQVIQGKEGWLFYEGTLDDYQDEEALSERELANIQHNLELMAQYAASQNIGFYVTIAPNKNQIYPDQMPDRYRHSEQNNFTRLQERMVSSPVKLIDLHTPLQKAAQKEKILYYKEDSHWNSQGALEAYDTLMQQMGLTNRPLLDDNGIRTAAQAGDLVIMLHPERKEQPAFYEEEPDWQLASSYTWIQGEEDRMADTIQTWNPQGQGSLLMFRDSFAKGWLDYLAGTFQNALFERAVPYNLYLASALPDCTIVIERVERRLGSLQEQASLMDLSPIALASSQKVASEASIQIKPDGDFLRISGRADTQSLKPESLLYVQAQLEDGTTKTWPVFHTAGEDHLGNGFDVFLPKSQTGSVREFSLLQEIDGQLVQTAWTDEIPA